MSQRAGIPLEEAEKRVDAAFADAQRAVEKARKAAALTGLLTASALLISLAAAWYAAQRGGYSRDHNLWAGAPWLGGQRPPLCPEATLEGAPITLVSQTLGHADLKTTNIYAHARPNDSSSRYLKRS